MEALVLAALLAAGLEPHALGLVDNLVRHEAPAPQHAPPLVRELLARPLDARDAGAIFTRTVPPWLRDAVERPSPPAARPFREALDAYIAELAQAQRLLGTGPADDKEIIEALDKDMLSADRLSSLQVDGARIDRAGALLASATLRFAHAARLASDFPPPQRFESAIGTVVVGSRGDDRHGPAALVVDPGGNDRYERAPATGGAVSVIVDLGGDDRYSGSDVAVRALSAIVDFAGDDRYEMASGLGAAIAGVSLLLDFAGNDSYESRHFAQGAAASGIGALVDAAGNDSYRIVAWGQGYGAAGGVGLLWDRAGNDRYRAGGIADTHERSSGGLSGAQGAAMGVRNIVPGGVGVLRDDAGDDEYEAEMFAQGLGYYYGIGVLWDGGGDDRYRASRYAQGAAAHEALGVLRDETGDDRYELSFGVGQGMGLDLALGALADGAGDDRYSGGALAQGTATANGIGILEDAGGSDRFELRNDPQGRAWGHAEGWAGLPSIGLFLRPAGGAAFTPERRASGRVFEAVAEKKPCEALPVEELATRLGALRRDSFDAVYALGQAISCAALTAQHWRLLEEELAAHPATPLAQWMAGAPEPFREGILRRLAAHPSCRAQAAGLRAGADAATALAALRGTCWRLQAAATGVLRRLGAWPGL